MTCHRHHHGRQSRKRRDDRADLVNGRFAACVQILPLGSIYRWNERWKKAKEWMLICKIRSTDYGAVEAAILDVHHYETPEILAVPVLQGFQPYLDWIKASTIRYEEEA